ncbi:MAG: hypothetical protein IJ841_01660 [Prevotella sp.]|nr:hypothetical protein [Prevotella sp.]
MKKMMFTLIALLAMAASASAMSYERARQEALFLTDKMAYELNLTDAQYEAAYEINLDYLMGVTSQYDVFGTYWERRNMDLQFILYSWQWEAFRAATYFFRPLYWDAGYWHFGVYARYPRRDYFYFGRPHFYASYRGGHSWRMNGNRSYYEHHRDHFRPVAPREQHFGMRDGWNRGDYRSGGGRGNSSTRVTGPNGDRRPDGRDGRLGGGNNGANGNNRMDGGNNRMDGGNNRMGGSNNGVNNSRMGNDHGNRGSVVVGNRSSMNRSVEAPSATRSAGAASRNAAPVQRSSSVGTRSIAPVQRSATSVQRSAAPMQRSSSVGSRSATSVGGSRSGGGSGSVRHSGR